MTSVLCGMWYGVYLCLKAPSTMLSTPEFTDVSEPQIIL